MSAIPRMWRDDEKAKQKTWRPRFSVRALVFLTSRSVATQIRREDLGAAWEIANIYLGSIGAERLDGSSQHIVGFSVDTTCYVSTQYFSANDPFEVCREVGTR